MSNPTTPFSWQMPTATDLVTDLPADFEVFGQAVATSMADLLGGTSGQILAKNSNTDMDFVWIANDQGDITGITASSPLTGGGTSGAVTLGILSGTTSNLGAVQLSDSTSSTSTTLAATANAVKSAYDLANAAIPKSLIDAAGDLIVGTAADTAGRLGIGTAGQVLKVNSGATALEWGAAATASGLTLVNRASFSNVASVNYDSVFSSTYKSYLVILEEIGAATTSDDLLLLPRYGSTTITSGYYGNRIDMIYSSTTITGVSVSNASNFVINNNTYQTTGQIVFTRVGTAADNPVFQGTTMSAGALTSSQFWCNATTGGTVTGFQLKSSSTNITGTVAVYGLAAS